MFSFCYTSHVYSPLHNGAFLSSPTTFQIETRKFPQDMFWKLPKHQHLYLDDIDIYITFVRSSATNQCSNSQGQHTPPPPLLPPSTSSDDFCLRSHDIHRAEEIRFAVAAVRRIMDREHITLTEEELIDKILGYILLEEKIDPARFSDTLGSTYLCGLPKFADSEGQVHEDCRQASRKNNELDDSPKAAYKINGIAPKRIAHASEKQFTLVMGPVVQTYPSTDNPRTYQHDKNGALNPRSLELSASSSSTSSSATSSSQSSTDSSSYSSASNSLSSSSGSSTSGVSKPSRILDSFSRLRTPHPASTSPEMFQTGGKTFSSGIPGHHWRRDGPRQTTPEKAISMDNRNTSSRRPSPSHGRSRTVNVPPNPPNNNSSQDCPIVRGTCGASNSPPTLTCSPFPLHYASEANAPGIDTTEYWKETPLSPRTADAVERYFLAFPRPGFPPTANLSSRHVTRHQPENTTPRTINTALPIPSIPIMDGGQKLSASTTPKYLRAGKAYIGDESEPLSPRARAKQKYFDAFPRKVFPPQAHVIQPDTTGPHMALRYSTPPPLPVNPRRENNEIRTLQSSNDGRRTKNRNDESKPEGIKYLPKSLRARTPARPDNTRQNHRSMRNESDPLAQTTVPEREKNCHDKMTLDQMLR